MLTTTASEPAAYAELLTRLADAELERALQQPIPTSPYRNRQVMALVRAAAVCSVNPRSRWWAEVRTAELATAGTSMLAGMQGPDGLFSSSGNVSSPPDSSFTTGHLAETVLLLRAAETWPEVRAELESILDRVTPGLLTGGVHTPNHRWELAAALARADQVRPDPAVRERVEVWLSEGIDLDDSGLYSERSANYAAYVSNPSLLVLADHTGRSELADSVHRNLHAQADLTDPDGVVETVFSRRQDQHLRDHRTDHDGFSVGAFLTQFRRFAVAGCARCAGMTRWITEAADPERTAPDPAGPAAGIDPIDALADLLAHPELGTSVPVTEAAPARTRVFDTAEVAVLRRGRTMTVISAHPDAADTGRIASGLAGNPTLLRWRNGDALLSSIRVSREFFGLGPFRAERLRQLDEDTFELSETVGACYYQPLLAADRRSDGSYRLEHEGRFAAQMSFADRARDRVELSSTITVEVGANSLSVHADFDGPPTACTIELGFAPGGDLGGPPEGIEPLDEDRHRLLSGGSYRRGRDRINITAAGDHDPELVTDYNPGETYGFLGGTDAVGGPRLYLGCRVPGRVTLTLTAA